MSFPRYTRTFAGDPSPRPTTRSARASPSMAADHRPADRRPRALHPPAPRPRTPWSGLALGCALARFLLRHVVPDGTVALVGDDTVGGHTGEHVHGTARHRDPVRSTHSFTAWRHGHRWVVWAVLVKFPFATRPWALPVLIDLYRSEEDNRKHNRTPAQLMCRLLRLTSARFPDRTFPFVGDSGYGPHALARFCHRRRARLGLVSKLHPDANLFALPPPCEGNGRPRAKGDRLPNPRQVATATPILTEMTVN